MKPNLPTLALAAALFQVLPGLAADIDCLKAPQVRAAKAVLNEILDKADAGCYGIKQAPQELKPVQQMLDKANVENEAAEKKRMAAALLQAVRDWTAGVLKDPVLRQELPSRLSAASAALTARDASNVLLKPVSWRVESSGGGLASQALGKTDLAGPVQSRCPAQDADARACAAAIADLEAVMRGHTIAELTLQVARGDELLDLETLFVKRADMWKAYRTEARPQYPWEWLLNSAFYRDHRPTDENGNPKGLADLPNGQVIFLHPGVGLERFDMRGTAQSSNNATLYMEWIGYNRLKWSYDEGKLRDGLGVSFVSVYSPRQDAKRWSRGVMLWVSSKYGIAMTRNSEGTSIMVSADLSELFRDKLNALNDKLPVDLSRK
jgi:hypothetical protein